ncbi:MAG: hypothetical protein N2712_07190 [Brevinematales bacterium]|nr:hypothetical protein [Brevinematales bacterium]
MEKIKLPPEFKNSYHLKEEDLERLNKHIDRFEEEKKKKRILRRWIFSGVILILVFMFLFGLADLEYIKGLFTPKTFLIKDSIETDEFKVNIRISMPITNNVNIIIEPIKIKPTLIKISNKNENKKIYINQDIQTLNIKYDRKIFFIHENKILKIVNIESLKPME